MGCSEEVSASPMAIFPQLRDSSKASTLHPLPFQRVLINKYAQPVFRPHDNDANVEFDWLRQSNAPNKLNKNVQFVVNKNLPI